MCVCLCRSGGGQCAGGRVSADVCGLQGEVWRPEEPQTAAHRTALHLYLTTPPCPLLPPHHLTLSHQPPPLRLGPPLTETSASSALAGRGACWDAELEHFLGAGPSRLAVWSPSGLPLPLLLRETVGPHELIDRDWTQRGGAGEGGREGGTERVLTSPFFPPRETFYICRHRLVRVEAATACC